MTTSTQSPCDLSFEFEMTKEKLQEYIKYIENAEKIAVPGQVLRIRINHAAMMVFRKLDKAPVLSAVTVDSETKIEN